MEENSKKNLLVVISNKIADLEREGIKFLLKFTDLGEKFELAITATGKKTMLFILSVDDQALFLENPEFRTENGRPTFFPDDMIVYLLILANGGQIIGKLNMPGENMFEHLEKVPQT